MELPEDVYENELIDAFDVPESKALASPKSPNTSPHHTNTPLRQPTCSNVQEVHTKTKIPTLYPRFDDSGAPVLGARGAPSQPQQQHQITRSKVQEWNAPLPAQAYHAKELTMTVDLQKKQQQHIEHEMRVYQERFDYIAQALAGETPHQIQKRTTREDERVERQEKRREAVETRLQHQLEHIEEREERHARLQARHHQASNTPSPGSGCDSQSEVVENGVGLDDKSNYLL